MHEIIKHRSRPSSRTNWKPRLINPPKSEKAEPKDPEVYIHQSIQLRAYLTKLQSYSSLISEGKFTHLEVGNFLSVGDFNAPHGAKDYFESYGLRFSTISENGTWSTAYFKIIDLNKLLSSLEFSISELEAYSKGELSNEGFTNQRIKLIRYFRLSTEEVKDQVSRYLTPSSKLRLIVDFISPVSNFSEIARLAAQQTGVEIEILRDGVVDISELHREGITRVADFAKKISNYDQVKYIRMDDFVFRSEVAPFGGSINEVIVNISNIGQNAPVVAVVDSGVQRNHLTNAFLTDEGLDFITNSSGSVVTNFIDRTDHGTSVACEIVYGKGLRDLLIESSVDELTPVAKIFPVRVFDDANPRYVDFEEVFSINGKFSQAVRKYNIKIVNLSFSYQRAKLFSDTSLSKAAGVLDKFAKEYDVVFVVCTGNTEWQILTDLAIKYPDLSFYSRPEQFKFQVIDESEIENQINIFPPGDLLSGLTVGSAFTQRNRAVVSSFSKSYAQKKYVKPDIVSEGGGDFPINLDDNPPTFCLTSGRVMAATTDASRFSLVHGTSLSTPKVSRALAIESVIYPDLNATALKALFLHKTSKKQAVVKKSGQRSDGTIQRNFTLFHKAFLGYGYLPETEEDILLKDSDNEVSYIIEDKISSNELLTYKIPIAKLVGDRTTSKTNKLELRLSVCFAPDQANNPKSLLEMNTTHIAAIAHKSGYDLLYSFEKNGKNYENRLVSEKTDPNYKRAILTKWTSDYYQVFFPVFSIEKRQYIKEELFDKLDDNEEIEVSVRCYSKSVVTNKPFVIILSVEDLGATGQIRNLLNIEV